MKKKQHDITTLRPALAAEDERRNQEMARQLASLAQHGPKRVYQDVERAFARERSQRARRLQLLSSRRH